MAKQLKRTPAQLEIVETITRVVSPAVPATITLELTEREAFAVFTVIGKVPGPSGGDLRKELSTVYNVLSPIWPERMRRVLNWGCDVFEGGFPRVKDEATQKRLFKEAGL